MSFQAQAWARSKTTGSPVKKAVLMAVANYADEEGVCWPSQNQLAEDTELSRHSILRALQELEDDGYLTRQHRHGKNGYRTADLITLDLGSTQLRCCDQRSSQAEPMLQPATAINKPSLEPSLKIITPKTHKRKEYPPLFESFWKSYPTDPNMAKAEALTEWEKLPAADHMAAIASLPNYKAYLAKKPTLEVIHACRYLKKRRFDGHSQKNIIQFVSSHKDSPQPGETRQQWLNRTRST